MCSKCKKGFSPLVYTYEFDCIRCLNSKYNNWLKFFAIAFVPLTISVYVSHYFQDKCNQPIHGFITLNQAVGTPINLRSIFIALTGKFKLVTRIIVLDTAHFVESWLLSLSLLTDYLKKCKKISILSNEDSGWRASIHCGSAWFSTPIAARTRSRTSRDIT
jgi:hypothetical protein